MRYLWCFRVLKYPSEPEVGVGVVVLDGDKILLIKRKYPPGAGKWSVPGGHVKLGESLYDAAVRELKEETGIDGEPLGVINVDELVEYDSNGKIRYHYVLVDVLVKPKTSLERARPSSDALDVKIVPLKDSLNLDLTLTCKSLIKKLLSGKYCIIRSNFIQYTC